MIDTTGYEKIGTAQHVSTRKGPKGIFHPGDAVGWWKWDDTFTPASPGRCENLEQIRGSKALVFIDRNTGDVFRLQRETEAR